MRGDCMGNSWRVDPRCASPSGWSSPLTRQKAPIVSGSMGHFWRVDCVCTFHECSINPSLHRLAKRCQCSAGAWAFSGESIESAGLAAASVRTDSPNGAHARRVHGPFLASRVRFRGVLARSSSVFWCELGGEGAPCGQLVPSTRKPGSLSACSDGISLQRSPELCSLWRLPGTPEFQRNDFERPTSLRRSTGSAVRLRRPRMSWADAVSTFPVYVRVRSSAMARPP